MSEDYSLSARKHRGGDKFTPEHKARAVADYRKTGGNATKVAKRHKTTGQSLLRWNREQTEREEAAKFSADVVKARVAREGNGLLHEATPTRLRTVAPGSSTRDAALTLIRTGLQMLESEDRDL